MTSADRPLLAPITADSPITPAGVTTRTYNALNAAGFRIWREVWATSDAELRDIPNLGRKSINEIRTLETAFEADDPMAITPQERLVAETWARAEGRDYTLADIPKARAVLRALGLKS